MTSRSAARQTLILIGRSTFERCWPNIDLIKQFRFLDVLEQDGEVFMTCELEKTDGTRGRNTEFFVVEDGRVLRAVALARCE